MIKLKNIYENRPFQTRNADEFNLENILDLFVDPTDGLIGCFDYENTIVKGKMGSGKTMYLRANQAYYMYTLVPSLLNESEIILPIYIKLSDFQNFKKCDAIYAAIIVRVVEEMTNSLEYLQSGENMANLHRGFQLLNTSDTRKGGLNRVLKKLSELTSDEYIETVQSELAASGHIGNDFLNACANYSNSHILELKKSGKPRFEDIVNAYNEILKPYNGKLLILFDEVGSLNKDFFKEDGDSSLFEVIMNQLRTLPFVRTKIAIYPYGYSDILTETRYGDNIKLEADIIYKDYESFLNRTIALIDQYLTKSVNEECTIEDLFYVTSGNYAVIEQLIYASDGNMRRLVHLTDMAMNEAFKRAKGSDKINLDDVRNALEEQSKSQESLFSTSEQEWLLDLVKVCKSRGAYRFTFPNKSLSLVKYVNKSAEYNIIKIIEPGTGRKSTVYAFDYAYCNYREIPTHYITGSERLDKSRSRVTGDFIKKITKISDNLIEQAILPNKIEGEIVYLNKENISGFVKDDNAQEYFINHDEVIIDDRSNMFRIGKRIRFIPVKLDSNLVMAKEIEIL